MDEVIKEVIKGSIRGVCIVVLLWIACPELDIAQWRWWVAMVCLNLMVGI